MAARQQHIDARDDVLTVVTADRPGVFSRVAGVLALHGLGVLRARAWSSDDGMAINQWVIESNPDRPTPWDRVERDVGRALAGRLALQARLAEKASTYRRRVKSGTPTSTSVSFDTNASNRSTVVDVQAPDAVGVLYRITRALAELDLDIRGARVQTLGSQVVDAFYVRDGDGNKITDPEFLHEIERAVLGALAS
jgi:[protein-PII] uridylyltransferase